MKYSIIHPHKYLLTIVGVCKLVVVCTNTEGLVPSIGCCQVLFLLSFSKPIAQNITSAFIPQAPRNVLSNAVFAADLESCLAMLDQYRSKFQNSRFFTQNNLLAFLLLTKVQLRLLTAGGKITSQQGFCTSWTVS